MRKMILKSSRIFNIYKHFIMIMITVLILLSNTNSYAEIKTYILDKESIITEDKSQIQVEKEITKELLREAAERAGIHVNTSTLLINESITESNISTESANISQKQILEKKISHRNGLSYLYLKLKIDVDTTKLEQLVEQSKNIKKLNSHIEELQNKISELEKNAAKNKTVDELNRELSLLKKKINKVETDTLQNKKLEEINLKMNKILEQILNEEKNYSYNANTSTNANITTNKGRYTKKYYYENGILKSEVPYLNNIIDGILRNYFSSGQLKSETTYREGMKHGSYKFYYDNNYLHKKNIYNRNGQKSITLRGEIPY